MNRVLVLTGRTGGALAVLMPIARRLGEVCALALAPPDPEAEAPLRAALALGATRAVALWDEQLATTDYCAVAQTLAAAARTIGFDFILCRDGRRGLLGPALAEQLGIPHLCSVTAAEERDGRLVARRIAWAAMRSYAATAPLLLAFAETLEPAAITEAGTAATPSPLAVERLTLAEAGISAAEIRWRSRFAPRPAPPSLAAPPRRFADAAELASRLVDDGLVAPAGRRKDAS